MLEQVIARWGALAVLLGAAVEGDATMILAGVMAHLGLLRIPTVFGAGALGGFASDLAWYALGRTQAATIRGSRLYLKALPTIGRFTRTLGAWEIGIARFVHGTRVASMLFWGAEGLPFWRFAAIDSLGCALWAAVLGAVGYTLNGSVEALVGQVRRVEIWFMVAAAGLFAVVFGIRLFLRRRAPKQGDRP